MAATKGKGWDVYVWCGAVLRSVVEVFEARIVRLNWQRSGLSANQREHVVLRTFDTSCWCRVSHCFRISFVLRCGHELEGKGLHNAIWLSKGNRYVTNPSRLMFTSHSFSHKYRSSSSRARSTRLGTIPKWKQRGTASASTKRFSHFSAGNRRNCSIR